MGMFLQLSECDSWANTKNRRSEESPVSELDPVTHTIQTFVWEPCSIWDTASRFRSLRSLNRSEDKSPPFWPPLAIFMPVYCKKGHFVGQFWAPPYKIPNLFLMAAPTTVKVPKFGPLPPQKNTISILGGIQRPKTPQVDVCTKPAFWISIIIHFCMM